MIRRPRSLARCGPRRGRSTTPMPFTRTKRASPSALTEGGMLVKPGSSTSGEQLIGKDRRCLNVEGGDRARRFDECHAFAR